MRTNMKFDLLRKLAQERYVPDLKLLEECGVVTKQLGKM